jgi:hypothetical protein
MMIDSNSTRLWHLIVDRKQCFFLGPICCGILELGEKKQNGNARIGHLGSYNGGNN